MESWDCRLDVRMDFPRENQQQQNAEGARLEVRLIVDKSRKPQKG